MDQGLALQLRDTCDSNPSGGFAFFLDPTPVRFDNAFYRNLQGGRGLLGTDQVLYSNQRSHAQLDSGSLPSA